MKIRKLAFDDKDQFLSLLNELNTVGAYDDDLWERVFTSITTHPSQYCLVATIGPTIVGTISGFIRQTFLHEGGKTGYPEDVIVHPDHRNKGICTNLMSAMDEIFMKEACYKSLGICEFGMHTMYKSSGYNRTQEEIVIRKDFA